MEYLFNFFSNLAEDPSRAGLFFSVTIGMAICLLGLAVMLIFTGLFDPIRRRLNTLSGSASNPVNQPQSLAKSLSTMSPLLLPKAEQERSKVQTMLIQTGYRSESSMITYYAIKSLLSIVLASLVLIAAPFFSGLSTQQVIMGAFGALGLGMFLPNWFLSHQLNKRKRKLLNGFPDALDLMVTCTEAGLGFNAAMQKVADELYVSHPLLAEELELVNAEIRAGIERVRALKDLTNRTGLDEIRGLVSMICQSVRFGTSIADTLRIFSEEFRDKRMQKAEEAAAKISTKMIFPLVFCMFPSFFLVAIGPAVLGVLKVLRGM